MKLPSLRSPKSRESTERTRSESVPGTVNELARRSFSFVLAKPPARRATNQAATTAQRKRITSLVSRSTKVSPKLGATKLSVLSRRSDGTILG